MPYQMYSPGAAQMLRAMFGPQGMSGYGQAGPISYNAERKNNAAIQYGTQLMRGTGNPQGTTSGAVRDVGEKIAGAVLSGYFGKKYKDQEKTANEQWTNIIGGGDGLEGMQQRAQAYGANLDPKVGAQIGNMAMISAMDKPNQDFQREQWEWNKSQADRNYALQERQLQASINNAAAAREAADRGQVITIPDEYGRNMPVIFDPRTRKMSPAAMPWLTGQQSPASAPQTTFGGPMVNPPEPQPTAPTRQDVQLPKLQDLAGMLKGQQPSMQPLPVQMPHAEPQALPQQSAQGASQPIGLTPGMVVDGSGQPVQVPAGIPWGKQEKQYIGGKEYYGTRTPNGVYFKIGGEVPPTPQEQKLARENAKIDKAAQTEKASFLNNYTTANNAFGDIERALSGGVPTGLVGRGGAMIPGTSAYDLNQSLETLKALVMVDTLGQLKAASPTGASGFGALSDTEGRRIAAMKGSLDIGQNPTQLLRNVRNIKREYDNMLRGWGYDVPMAKNGNTDLQTDTLKSSRSAVKRYSYNPQTGRIE